MKKTQIPKYEPINHMYEAMYDCYEQNQNFNDIMKM